MRGGAFFNGKEGRVDFRKKTSLTGKSCANEHNESSLTNCRVQPALSIKEGLVGFRKKHILSEIQFERQPLKAK